MTYPEPITELNPEFFVYIVCRQSWCCLTLTQNAARDSGIKYFPLININLKLKFYAQANFSLLLLSLGSFII